MVLLVDLFLAERSKWALSTIAGLGLLASFLPIVTLALDATDVRACSAAAYVVDDFSLVLKALFLLSGYVVILMSTNYIEEGDYYQGEYYFLLLSSVLGMVMMASRRDLVSIFVALELLSIPAYMLAAWRKRDTEEQRGGHEVLPARRVRLGRDALRHVAALRHGRHHAADRHRPPPSARRGNAPIITLGIVFVVVGFAFKVSAVPVPHLGARHLRRRARRRSPRSCRWRRRRPASSPC